MTVEEAARAMGATVATVAGESLLTPFPSVSTDTRTVSAGQCFFCLAGPRFDAHDFIPEALNRGAAYIVHSKPIPESTAQKAVFLRVEDPLSALQTLAHYARTKWAGPLVGITGSAGKTTTRAFTAGLLSTEYEVLQSRGNLNNQIGLPLSLLGLEEHHQVATVEMGMNHAGELSALTWLAMPQVAVLTNVAPVHLEFFSSLDEIAAAKAEILEPLAPGDLIVFNADDPRVTQVACQHRARRLSFGIENEADVRVANFSYDGLERMEFRIESPVGNFLASVPFVGRYFLYNLAAAIAVAVEFEIPASKMKEAIGALEPVAMRGRVLQIRDGNYAGVTVWDDSYNANPQAVTSVLETVANLEGFRRKIVALGDMLELGPSAPDWHRDIGQKVAASGIDLLVAVGKQAGAVGQGARDAGMPRRATIELEKARQAADYLGAELTKGDFLLVKGSRGIGMDVVVRTIEGK